MGICSRYVLGSFRRRSGEERSGQEKIRSGESGQARVGKGSGQERVWHGEGRVGRFGLEQGLVRRESSEEMLGLGEARIRRRSGG